ncbi:MAG: hypothetical protein M3Q56_10155 [Bacteroidota bacterium]|nr:hypothetical protein [Bacteroidota bacterium]
MKHLLLLTGIILYFLASCANPNKIIERGDYDEAIKILTEKLRGKKNKDRNQIKDLELAFKKANEKSLREEQALRAEGLAENWPKIYTIYTQIEKRQTLIDPMLPIESKDGYQGHFSFINTLEIKRETKQNSAEYFYSSALNLIDQAKSTKDKAAARKAYDYLVEIDRLFTQFKDKEQLKKVAVNLGLTHYLVKMVNHTQTIMPERFEDELLKISVENLNTRFKSFDIKSNSEVQYDYYILLYLTQIDFSPEREKSRIYDDVNEVEKEEILKDNKGKPVLDSLGKPKKIKVKENYTATIEEITQNKVVSINGRIEWLTVEQGEIVFSKPVAVEAVFENFAAKLIRGNTEYLSETVRRKLRGKLVPFPRNETMILDAGEKLKKIMKDIIWSREK